MNLKRKIIAIAIAAGAAPAIAFAGSANTINFQGEVTTQTCSVERQHG